LNNSEKNIYIQSVKLNGKPYSHSYIAYKDIMQGGNLEFEMGPLPNKEFGSRPEDRPASVI
jgi:putative alpha-1,2-mannosidase